MCLCGSYMVRQQGDTFWYWSCASHDATCAAGQEEEADTIKVTWVTDQASSETSSEVVIPRTSGCSAHTEQHLLFTQPSCSTCEHELLSQVNTLWLQPMSK